MEARLGAPRATVVELIARSSIMYILYDLFDFVWFSRVMGNMRFFLKKNINILTHVIRIHRAYIICAYNRSPDIYQPRS